MVTALRAFTGCDLLISRGPMLALFTQSDAPPRPVRYPPGTETLPCSGARTNLASDGTKPKPKRYLDANRSSASAHGFVMTYTLHRLAPGSYDILLHGEIIGGIVRNVSVSGELRGWRVELIEDLRPEQRPEPFTEIEHSFRTFNAVRKWLGDPEVTQDLSKALRLAQETDR